MMKVKICGITNSEDALAAAEFGADAVGFVFYERSPRFITPEKAGEIVRAMPPFLTAVGVFVNEHPSRMQEIIRVSGVNMVQLHGDEPQEMCDMWPRVIKAFRVRDFTALDMLKRYRAAAYLLDAYTEDTLGGTGQIFNWDIAADARQFGKVILAGGLTPENVERAVRVAHPYGVDVSTGVERDKGIKDHRKMKVFIERARGSALRAIG